MTPFNEVEQEVADQLFIRHNMLLGKNGSVEGVMVGLEMHESWSGGNWRHSHRTGRYGVKVGGFMSTKVTNFRELKNGGYNYDKIADKLVDTYNTHQAEVRRRKERDNRSQDYDAMIQRAFKKHDIYEYGSTLAKKHSKDYTRIFGLQVTLNVTTNDQIDQLLTLAKELGINIR